MSNSPLLGYNNNIPYKGRVYHVQTEDSGAKRPHVITHLFADGGRIVNTTKTSYAHFVGSENMAEKVRALMREQHRAMVVSLRDGEFDELLDPTHSSPGASRPGASSPSVSSSPGASSPGLDEPDVDPDALTAEPPAADEGDASGPQGFGTADTVPPAPGLATSGGERRGRSDGAYKKIVGRASPLPGGGRKRPVPPPRRTAATRPNPQAGRGGGALFGQAVRAHRSVPPGPPNVAEHGEPFGARYTSERSLDEVVSTFFEGA